MKIELEPDAIRYPLGLEIAVDGFPGDSRAKPTQVFIEVYEGKLRVHLWKGDGSESAVTTEFSPLRNPADSQNTAAQGGTRGASSVEWQMTIPVVSTCHVQKNSLTEFAGVRPLGIAEYVEGAFVHVDCLCPDDRPALRPLAIWFRNKYPNEKWLRFDRDGDVIAHLPQFEW